MLKRKLPKIILVLTLILILTIPDTLTLLAASLTLTNTDTTADLQISLFHEGGEESSNTLNEEQRALYDETQYVYNVGTSRVYKIIKKNDTDFSNALYCLNALKAFPGVTAEGNNSLSYTNIANFKESSDTDVQSLYMGTEYSADSDKWNSNYKALTWLMNNIYLRKQLPIQKDSYLEKAFVGTGYDLQTVKAILTDDDIDVVQQYAIWHFTNNDSEKYALETIPSIRLTAMDPMNPSLNLNETKSYAEIDEKYSQRQDMANKLYQYLIQSAEANKNVETQLPTIETSENTVATISNGFYVAGPIKVTRGNVEDFTVKLVNQDGEEIPRDMYTLIANDEIQTKSLKELAGDMFFICIPTSVNIEGFKLVLDYNAYKTDVSVWRADDDTERKFQDVALITRQEGTGHEEREFKLEKIEGSYEIEVVKQDKDSKVKLSGAEFSVQIGSGIAKTYTTDDRGTIKIPKIDISEEGKDRIKIMETRAPEGYERNVGTLELDVEKEIKSTGENSPRIYSVKGIEVVTELKNTTATCVDGKITVTVEDEKIPEEVPTGSYDLEILKIDSETKESLEGAIFSVQIGSGITRRYTTDENGIIRIPTVEISEIGKDIIKIKEVSAPDGYKGVAGTIEVEASKVLVAGKYSVSSITTTSAGSASASLINGKITVTVQNEKIVEPPKPTGTYNLQIVKKDKTTDSILEGADFSIQFGNEKAKKYRTDEHGIIYIPDVEIKNLGTQKIKIEEVNAPDGYLASDGVLEMTLKAEEIGGKYVITSFDSERTEVDAEAFLEDDTLLVVIRNQRIKTEIPEDPNKLTGKYEVYIEKIDQNKELITDYVARFNVNERLKSTQNGRVKIADVNINSSTVGDIDTYTIKETKAPNGYTKFDGTIEVDVFKALSKDEESYEISKTILTVKDSEGNEINRGDNVQVYYENGIPKVVIRIVNFEKADLALRKYISAVSKDETFESEDYLTDDDSRIPEVDLEGLDAGTLKTAKYNHPKSVVLAMKKDYILYSLRVYNEGNVNAYPTKIVDYLPEGIDFVEDAEINKIWDFDEETRTLTTNKNYEPQLLFAHQVGEELNYQELQLVCRVSEDVKEDTNIVNIAEIAEAKNQIGMIVEDRDSTQNNVKLPEDRSKYAGGTDSDKTDEYVPGQEDDDDFERIFVKSIVGKYNLEIVKVDENGKTITNQVTKFTIVHKLGETADAGAPKETKNGLVQINDIRIDKTNADLPDIYEIEETQAPKGYTKLSDKVELEVSKKFSDDGKSYIVDEVTIKGEKAEFETVEENGTTKIIVRIANRQQVDLSLRKFISGVSEDSTFEDEELISRAPIIDTKDLDDGKTTTAKYTHTKTAVKLKKGNYVLYSIRVYNEGNVNAVASQIKDYLPEDLEFVKDNETNAIWDYNEETRVLTTNDKYEAKVLKAHESGKELAYQELQVVCRVKDNAKEGVNIVNISEIAESKYEDGTVAEDRDSVPGNLEYPKDPSKYTGGKEDDEDYDRVYIEPEKVITGKYELTLTKVDSNNRTISSLKSRFIINDKDAETVSGKIKIANININKDNVNQKDVYTIKEDKAPEGYTKFDGSIEVEIEKALSSDGDKYEVSQATLKIKDKDGEEYKGTDKIATISVTKTSTGSKIEIKFVNQKQNTPVNPPDDDPTTPDDPKQPDDPKKDDPTEEPKKDDPKKEDPKKEDPKTEEPKKDEPKKEEPKTETPKEEEKKQTVTVPDTGDMLPIIAISVIGLVILANIIFTIVSKKKKKDEDK